MTINSSVGMVNLSTDAIRLEKLYISGYELKSELGMPVDMQGACRHAMSIGNREIKIEGYISEGLEENRRLITKICTSSEPFLLIDDGYCLESIAKKGPEFSYERRFRDKLLKFTIYAESIRPFWHSLIRTGVEFVSIGGTSSLSISVSSDTPVGFEAQLLMMTSAESMRFAKGEKYLEIQYPFSIGDTVFIDTRHGKKGVWIQKKGASTRESIIDSVSIGSSFFELDVGDNQISYSILTGALRAVFYYTPVYMR
ncbi:MAG: phage tail family protein [Clostridia bacterium]|nr:phage tail family protein [Clostridia bacterium]